MGYENWTLGHIRQTNPKQTQCMVSLPLRGNVEPSKIAIYTQNDTKIDNKKISKKMSKI